MEESNLNTHRLIYTECKDAFLDIWRSKESIEKSAKIYLSIYIAVLSIGLFNLGSFFKIVSEVLMKGNFLSYFLSFISYISILYCLLRGIWANINAIQLGDYITFPNLEQMVSSLQKKKEIAYFKSLYNYFTKAVLHNQKQLDIKVRFLKNSYSYMKATIIFIICFVIMKIFLF